MSQRLVVTFIYGYPGGIKVGIASGLSWDTVNDCVDVSPLKIH